MERALFMRLHLLQGILAFHTLNKEQARLLLTRVSALIWDSCHNHSTHVSSLHFIGSMLKSIGLNRTWYKMDGPLGVKGPQTFLCLQRA